MPILKEVWHYALAPSVTFNEVLYRSGDNVAAVTNVLGRDATIVTRRIALLDNLATLETISVSEVGSRGAAVPVPIGLIGRQRDSGNTSYYHHDAAVVVNLGSVNPPSRRKMWMRGWPAAAFLNASDDTPPRLKPRNADLLGEWLDVVCDVVGPKYIVLSRKKLADVGANFGVINQVIAHDDGTTTIKTNGANIPGVNQGDSISISLRGVPELRGISGTYLFAPTGLVGTYTIPFRAKAGTYDNIIDGRAWKAAYRENTFFSRGVAAFRYIGTRRSKNVGTGSRGARRAHKATV